jgi:hypothetical protein
MQKLSYLAVGIAFLGCATGALAQSEPHMRKFVPEAPPAHIEVLVTKAINGKPVANAEVIFHPIRNGKDKGNLEIKTNREGLAILDLIPVGDTVRLQVIADGFQTFGQDFIIDSDNKQLAVKMQKPVAQSSLYATPASAPSPAQPTTVTPATAPPASQ